MIYLLIWAAFAASTGIAEAFLFNYTKELNEAFKEMFKYDIHWLFVKIRAFHLIPILFLVDHWIIFALIAVFTFPFIHDGCYYQTRKILSSGKIYPKGFMDQSINTTAKLSFNFTTRLILFIFGAGMIFVII